MRIGVIPDFVPFRVFPAKNLRPLVRRQTNHEERRRDILFLQDVQDFWRPGWVRPVIEGDSKFFLGCSDLVDVVGERIGIVLLAGNEVSGGVVSKSAVTAFRSIVEVTK